jgi:hypothetical protein
MSVERNSGRPVRTAGQTLAWSRRFSRNDGAMGCGVRLLMNTLGIGKVAVRGLKSLALMTGVASSLGLFSCSFVVDFDQVQCKKTSECTKLGSDFKHGQCVKGLCQTGPECLENEECGNAAGCVEGACIDRWACITEEVPLATDNVTFAIPVVSIFQMPMPGIPVKLCSSVDTDCTSPTAELVSDENGLITFEVAPSFQGYLDTKVPGFFPQLNFLPDFLTNPPVVRPISLSPVEIIEGLAQQVGAAANPERGHLVISVASCLGPAPNLLIESGRADEQTIPYYVNGGVPAPDLKFTTDDGSGGYLNIVAGTGGVNISVVDGEELFKRNVFVRQGTISTVHFQPAAVAVAQANQNAE